MRVVNLEGLLKQPNGTVFMRVDDGHCAFRQVEIFHGAIGSNNDNFSCAYLPQWPVGVDDTGQLCDSLLRMYFKNLSMPMDTEVMTARDDCFDDRARFVILEKADVEALVGILQTSLKEAYGTT